MPRVIALSGWKGSGKDTVADYILKNYNAKRVAFADPLKDMVAEEYGIPREDMDDPKKKDAPIFHLPVNPQDDFSLIIADFMKKEFRFEGITHYWTPRALCILKGSTNRAVTSDYWVKRAISNIVKSDADVCVITDMRYHSELEQLEYAFRSELVTIRINRFDSSPSTDPSERDLDDADLDYSLNNRGTIEETHEKIKLILKLEHIQGDK